MSPKGLSIVYIMLADNKIDKYKVGVDATDGCQTVDYGNYGVLYKIAIPVKEGAPKVQYYLSPLGGTYAGTMTVRRDHSPYTKLIETPAGLGCFGDQAAPAVLAAIATVSRCYGANDYGRKSPVCRRIPRISGIPTSDTNFPSFSP